MKKEIKISSFPLIIILLFLISIFAIMSVYIVDIVKKNIYLEEKKNIAQMPDNIIDIAKNIQNNDIFVNLYKINKYDDKIILEYYGYSKTAVNNFNMIEKTTFYLKDDGKISHLDMETIYPNISMAKEMLNTFKVYEPKKITRNKNVITIKNGKMSEEYIAEEFFNMLINHYQNEGWIEIKK